MTSRLRMVTRLARLYVLSQESRYIPRLDDLSVRLGASTRTIRRDLEALERAGVPVRWRQNE